MKLLIVEDDEDVRAVTARALMRDGHVVRAAGSLEESRVALADSLDLLVLDLSLPDGSGLTLCRELRACGSRLPILILTAHTQVELRVEGWAAGADDYLVKPFGLAELRIRVRALGRRGHASPSLHRFKDVTIELGARRAVRGAQEVRVAATEWALLETLASGSGGVSTREELLDACGGVSESARNALDVLVARLHRKFGAGLIQTVGTEGYCLNGQRQSYVPGE